MLRRSVLALMAMAALALPAAGESTLSKIQISDVWTKASIAQNGAAYATFENTGKTMDRLIGVETPAANKAELHTHKMKDGVMQMRRVKAVELHPGAPVVFKPGGLHLMLFGLKKKWKEGEMMPLTLVFEQAGRIDVRAHVKAWGSGHQMKMDHKGHGDHGS